MTDHAEDQRVPPVRSAASRRERRRIAEAVAARSPFRVTTPSRVSDNGAVTADPIPATLTLAAGWSWRLLLVAALIAGIMWLFQRLHEVTVPLFVAVLFTAALWPMVEWLKRRGVPRGLAVALSMLMVLVLVGGIFTLVGAQIVSQSDQLGVEALKSYAQVIDWLTHGPLHLHQQQITDYLHKGQQYLADSKGRIASMAASAGLGVGHFLAGFALAAFTLFFLLLEGRRLAHGISTLVPKAGRSRLMDASGRGWTSLVAYVRAAVIVALCDGAGAGLGAAALGSNLFLAIGALTFVSAFVPLVGALMSGAVATGVVLVTLGFWKALIMLAVFILVMQLEGHVMQPFLLGRAVEVHPLAVLYGLAIGISVAGIVGGLFAVPLIAFGNAFLRSLRDDLPAAATPAASDQFPVDPSDPASGSAQEDPVN
ncbi:AI-2E family transporter [Aestuariimicrobium kwangyangense]|uniref:AI-2E family transporter n=1 Tax=Aestuariimicrobium kwangyangense TaxID=396389 RepID=UPI0003B4C0C6|nr:AI-2E family transporter [Aestuariimicrobium kwangyangense]